jgi:hypothetical protein
MLPRAAGKLQLSLRRLVGYLEYLMTFESPYIKDMYLSCMFSESDQIARSATAEFEAPHTIRGCMLYPCGTAPLFVEAGENADTSEITIQGHVWGYEGFDEAREASGGCI